MSLPTLNTVDPIALRYLMTETVFGVDGNVVDVPPGKREETTSAEPGAVKPDRTETPFVFYGHNKRNYLFLTEERQYKWMPETAMDAFVKTLAALKLPEADVALLNLAALAEPPTVDQLALFFNPKVVVNLGTSFTWPEQPGTTIFHTHTFADMLADAEKKHIFWTTIKKLLI